MQSHAQKMVVVGTANIDSRARIRFVPNAVTSLKYSVHVFIYTVFTSCMAFGCMFAAPSMNEKIILSSCPSHGYICLLVKYTFMSQQHMKLYAHILATASQWHSLNFSKVKNLCIYPLLASLYPSDLYTGCPIHGIYRDHCTSFHFMHMGVLRPSGRNIWS